MAQPLLAQVAVDSALNGFGPSGDFRFEVNGQDLAEASIYAGQGVYLILVPGGASVLVNARTQSAQAVDPAHLIYRDDGLVDLQEGATLTTLGALTIDGTAVTFDLNGLPARLKPSPPLLGLLFSMDILANRADYRHSAAAYQPSASELAALEADPRDVQVRVYFGTWCPACNRTVPNLLRVEEALNGAIGFAYYGFPPRMADDPIAAAHGIEQIPVAVVYVDGEEAGRLAFENLKTPEASLRRLLGGQ